MILSSLILSMGFTMAAVSLVSPAANTNHTGTITINATLAASDCAACKNVTILYNSSGGPVPATASRLVTITNDTAGDTEFYSASVSISALTDLATYNFTAYSDNGSDQAFAPGRAGITIDNTAPSCTSGQNEIQRANIEFGATQTLTCACTDGIDASPTATRTLYKPGSTTVTVTASPYTTSRSDINTVGTYTFECYGLDYTGNTVSNNQTFRVDTSEDDITSSTITTTSIVDSNRTVIMVGIIFLVVVIAGAGIILFNRN